MPNEAQAVFGRSGLIARKCSASSDTKRRVEIYVFPPPRTPFASPHVVIESHIRYAALRSSDCVSFCVCGKSPRWADARRTAALIKAMCVNACG